MVVDDLPSDVAALALAFADGLERVLGPRFAGLFVYGAACFPPSPVADFDYHALVTDAFSDADREQINELHAELERMPLGDEMDGYYVTLEAAAKRDEPRTERKPDIVDGAWAIHRAHIHAGRYVVIRGTDPREIVPEPTWEELAEALEGEVEWCVPHIEDARAYTTLQMCRILYSYEMRDVVTSKYQSALWSFGALPTEHHGLIRSALDAYFTKTYAIDTNIKPFFEEMRGRIDRARALV